MSIVSVAAAQTPRDTGTTIIRAGRLFDSEKGAFARFVMKDGAVYRNTER